MRYRQFGKLDWKASALGFGMMRLPTTSEKPEHINGREALRIVRHAIDQGVNYIDTAWAYHNERSEPFTGRVLQDGYRAKVRLATKLPCWLVETREDCDKYLNEQLHRLQTDHVDFYLLHALNRKSWRKMRDLGVLRWAEGAISDGRVGHLGFSFHDEYDAFQEIVDAYSGWAFCQIQYNYMDVEHQAGAKGLQYAASKGLAVVIMEPLQGGRLANPPARIRQIWARAPQRRSPVAWALHWLWSQPEVSLVLSGMTAMEHVQENLAIAVRSAVGTLDQEQVSFVSRVRDAYREVCPIPCTKCRYCMPCSSGVDIPRVLDVFNAGRMHDDLEGARSGYKWVPEAQRAHNCTQCLQCEEICPQQIPVSEWMERVEQVLTEGKPYEECLLP